MADELNAWDDKNYFDKKLTCPKCGSNKIKVIGDRCHNRTPVIRCMECRYIFPNPYGTEEDNLVPTDADRQGILFSFLSKSLDGIEDFLKIILIDEKIVAITMNDCRIFPIEGLKIKTGISEEIEKAEWISFRREDLTVTFTVIQGFNILIDEKKEGEKSNE